MQLVRKPVDTFQEMMTGTSALQVCAANPHKETNKQFMPCLMANDAFINVLPVISFIVDLFRYTQ